MITQALATLKRNANTIHGETYSISDRDYDEDIMYLFMQMIEIMGTMNLDLITLKSKTNHLFNEVEKLRKEVHNDDNDYGYNNDYVQQGGSFIP